MTDKLTVNRRGTPTIALAAGIALSLAFTFSCTTGDGGGSSPGNSVSYGGKTYKTVKIGTQTWMAENLNYDVAGGKCYGNDLANCAKYGMLYDWATAMALPSSCNSASCASQIYVKHQGICPSGWHLPSYKEWDALVTYIESDKSCTGCDAKHLRATSGWNSNGNGLDSYGFSALPGGCGRSDYSFYDVGSYGHWLSASEYGSDYAYYRYMFYYYEYAYLDFSYKSFLFSVRCLKD